MKPIGFLPPPGGNSMPSVSRAGLQRNPSTGNAALGRGHRRKALSVDPDGVGPRRWLRDQPGLLQVESLSCMVSTGFARALKPVCCGTVLVERKPSNIRRRTMRPLPCSSNLATHAMKAADAVKLAAAAERLRLHGTRYAVERKRQHCSRDAGDGLSYGKRRTGSSRTRSGISFIIIRTVSDVRDEDLPRSRLHLFLRPTGWIRCCLVSRDPSSVLSLSRLLIQSHMAGMHLRDSYEKFLSVETLATFT